MDFLCEFNFFFLSSFLGNQTRSTDPDISWFEPSSFVYFVFIPALLSSTSARWDVFKVLSLYGVLLYTRVSNVLRDFFFSLSPFFLNYRSIY